jgi:hypothetical protein
MPSALGVASGKATPWTGRASRFSEEKVKLFQLKTMRAGYLAQDRADLQRVAREFAKGMSNSCVRRWEVLKRAAR